MERSDGRRLYYFAAYADPDRLNPVGTEVGTAWLNDDELAQVRAYVPPAHADQGVLDIWPVDERASHDYAGAVRAVKLAIDSKHMGEVPCDCPIDWEEQSWLFYERPDKDQPRPEGYAWVGHRSPSPTAAAPATAPVPAPARDVDDGPKIAREDGRTLYEYKVMPGSPLDPNAEPYTGTVWLTDEELGAALSAARYGVHSPRSTPFLEIEPLRDGSSTLAGLVESINDGLEYDHLANGYDDCQCDRPKGWKHGDKADPADLLYN